MTIDRRELLRTGLLGFGATALTAQNLLGSFARATALGAPKSKGAGDKNLLVIFLRGGADGSSFTPPLSDVTYAPTRGTAAWAQAETTALSGVNYCRMINPLKRLVPVFNAGRLALIHQCGNPIGDRSHFEQFKEIEGAKVGTSSQTTTVGFLPKAVKAAGISNITNGMPAMIDISLVPQQLLKSNDPAALAAHARGLGFYSLDNLPAGPEVAAAIPPSVAAHILNPVDGAFVDGQLGQSSKFFLDAKTGIGALASSFSHDGVGFPTTEAEFAANQQNFPNEEPPGYSAPFALFMANAEQSIHALEEAGGPRVAAIDLGGWDTHTDHKVKFEDLSRCLGWALRSVDDITSTSGKTAVMVITEFGRTASVNGSNGLDHGVGSTLWMMGNFVKGGIYNMNDGLNLGTKEFGAAWRPLGQASTNPLWGNAVDVVTDFRHVFAEACEEMLCVPSGMMNDAIFDYSNVPGGYLNYLNIV